MPCLVKKVLNSQKAQDVTKEVNDQSKTTDRAIKKDFSVESHCQAFSFRLVNASAYINFKSGLGRRASRNALTSFLLKSQGHCFVFF